jgi:sec-independent protein translocase protein TatA
MAMVRLTSCFFSSDPMIESATSNVLLAFLGLGTPELLIVAAVFILLFGGAKLPSLMRNMGRSVNEFKTVLKEKPTDEAIEDQSENTSKNEEETPVG